MKINLHTKLIVLGIFLIAAFFRLYNVNWDSGFHLHPDERFLVMVANDMRMPASFSQYLDPQTSPFNPTNINYKFYVYGTFPVVLNKLLAQAFMADDYNGLLIQGRILSAFFDLLTVIYIFKFLFLLKKHHNLPREIVYLGSVFYALAVLPIQLSHFFAVDTFLNFFLLASLYYILKFYYEKSILRFIAGSIMFGLALACKISAIYTLPLLLFILLLTVLKRTLFTDHLTTSAVPRVILRSSALLLIFFLFSYLSLRIADPYYFANASFLGIQPNPMFIESVQQLKSYSNRDVWFPPSVQWLNKPPIIFSLYNLAFFGLGLFYILLVPIGIFLILRKHHSYEMIALFSWAGLFFLYQSTQLAQPMRYFLILYPFLAFAAAAGFHYLFYRVKTSVKLVLFSFILFWPICFFSIYVRPMTRVEASYWISHHIPQGSNIVGELWDDALPLRLPGNHYNIELLPVFDYDTAEKWGKMDEMLQKADYYILSSNRAWGSIPTVPDRYPKMTQFYKDLFADNLEFKRIKEFTSYPSLSYLGLPITIRDDMADESFTVYDHPKVIIFKKVK